MGITKADITMAAMVAQASGKGELTYIYESTIAGGGFIDCLIFIFKVVDPQLTGHKKEIWFVNNNELPMFLGFDLSSMYKSKSRRTHKMNMFPLWPETTKTIEVPKC